MSREYVPERGDIVWLDFTPQSGHEQAGHRPALVLSPAAYNRPAGLVVVCPITTQQKAYPFEVALPDSKKPGGVTGVVLADQVKSLDWRARHAEKAARAPRNVQQAVIRLVGRLLTEG